MDLLTEIIRSLASGKIICRASNADAFSFMQDPDTTQRIEEGLTPLGLQLAMTTEKTGFFAREASAEIASQQLKSAFRFLASESRRIEDFADFLHDAFADQEQLASDQIISVSKVLDAVSGSTALTEKLEYLTLTSSRSATTTARRVSNLFARLAQDEYLKCINTQDEIYTTTAKIDWARDITEHIASQIPTVVAAMEAASEADPGQGDLFA